MDNYPIAEKNKEPKRWRITKEANGITKTVEVEEAENGFIIIKRKEYEDKVKGWQSICKKWISNDNPLAKQEPVKDVYTPKDLFGGIDSFEL